MASRNIGLSLLGFAVLLLGAGCGAGVAGVAATSGGSSGGTTPTLTAFEVVDPKVSPAMLRIEASASVLAELSFQSPSVAETAMATLQGPGVSGSRVQLASGVNEVTWDFAVELGSADFVEDVDLFARHPNGTPIGGGSLNLGMGNDPPVIAGTFPPQIESDGVVPIGVRVSDSSSDVISVVVEWRKSDEPPDAWKPASAPEVLPGEDPNPLEDVQVSPDGTFLVFFWDTDRDLAEGEADVQLRFTPDDGTRDAQDDPIGRGEPIETLLFRVDNNEEPIVQLFNDLVITNPDERRGIPIPFRVIDEESDLVEVLFQWRREGEEFPSLDADADGTVTNAEIDAILADPMLRAGHHICAEYPRYAQGHVVPVDETSVRLPELASKESWILASGIEGRTLELMRPSQFVAPITPTWRANPLVAPIAALPVEDGLHALVLDAPGGTGRLREIELATGAIVREIATLGPGLPTAMAFEQREEAVLVASDLGGAWRLERIELASGAITELFVSDGTNEPPPVRGLASLGTKALCLTAGSSLLFLDYRDPLLPRLGVIRDDLATPWGVVVDPLATNQVYVAERDAVRPDGTGRVLAIELDSHEEQPVVVKTESLLELEAPEAIALDRKGARLLAVTTAPGGGRHLVGLNLGGAGGNVPFALGETFTTGAGGLASGPDGLLLVALPAANECLVGGGLGQRRSIVAHDSRTPGMTPEQRVTVDAAFDPAPLPGQVWRIPNGNRRRPAPGGTDTTFLWDSSDAGVGPVFLKGTPRDDELGTAGQGAAPKSLRAALDVGPLTLGSPATTSLPVSVAVADLDCDGDQDLVSANLISSNLTVFFQTSPGSFASTPQVLGDSQITVFPASVAAADLDGDGDQDLVSANEGGDDLTVFFQTSPGSFDPSPLTLGDSLTTLGPLFVAAADLDGDGDQDLVSANQSGDNLTVFFQTSPGSFDPAPLTLGDALTTSAPLSVAAADLDGDGDQDLVSANSANLTVFFQSSPGSFPSSPFTIPASTRSESVAAADLDGDGDQDLVAANGVSLRGFFQDSPGSYVATPLTLGDSQITLAPYSVVAADVDGDGDQDLVSANQFKDNLTVYFQSSPGSYASTPLTLGGSQTTRNPSSVAAADLDGDGDQDLVSANRFGGNLTAFFQSSAGSYASSTFTLGSPFLTSFPRSVIAADLDADGDQDLVSANDAGDNLTAFFQSSLQSFAATPLVLGGSLTTNRPFSVAAADLEGDGDQDLVSANGDGDNLTVFFQGAPGTFASPPVTVGGSATIDFPTSVVAVDLDGDGDQDLASSNTFGDNLTVFFQSRLGTFPSTPLVLGNPVTTTDPFFVAAADLDGDGDLDLVTTDGNALAVFFQLSPRVFASPPRAIGSALTTSNPTSIAAADLDGDGDQDLVSANEGGETLTVFFQSSPGRFPAPPLTLGDPLTTLDPFSVAAVDLDGDGDLDLVSANASDPTVFFQSTPGSFPSPPLVLGGLPVDARFLSVAASDFDGDGDPDLVFAGIGVNNLTVFLGGR